MTNSALSRHGDAITPVAYLTDTEHEPVHLLARAAPERNQADGLTRALAHDLARAFVAQVVVVGHGPEGVGGAQGSEGVVEGVGQGHRGFLQRGHRALVGC